MTQQEFLREAMARTATTREQFAEMIGVSCKALDNWLLPDGSKSSRRMPQIAEKFISKIVLDYPQ